MFAVRICATTTTIHPAPRDGVYSGWQRKNTIFFFTVNKYEYRKTRMRDIKLRRVPKTCTTKKKKETQRVRGVCV